MKRESREIGPVGRQRKEKRRKKSRARRSFKKFIKVGRNSCAKTLPRLRREILRRIPRIPRKRIKTLRRQTGAMHRFADILVGFRFGVGLMELVLC
jgi:hypothetical protein